MTYEPKYSFLQKSTVIPDFKRFVPRDNYKYLRRFANDVIDSDKIIAGYEILSEHSKTPGLVSFDNLTGRLTTSSTRVSKNSAFLNKNSVTFIDFLPNSMKSSPMRRDFSHSFVSEKLGLRRHTSQRQDLYHS